MKFYTRKPLEFGGIRFDPLEAESGTSVEIHGPCLFSHLKGYSVRLERNGIYYHIAQRPTDDSLPYDKEQGHSHNPSSSNSKSPQLVQAPKSKSSEKLSGSFAQEFTKELNRKQKSIYLWPFALLLAFIPKFGVFISIALLPILHFLVDKPRKTTFLYYDISPEVENEIQLFFRTFNELFKSHFAWLIFTQEKIDVVKYQAGASWLVRRARLKISYRTPPMLKTNILVPCLSSSKCKFYFLPDRVLVQKHAAISSIRYADMKITQKNTKFIEDQAIPPDSKIAGRTWRFVNIDGTPDKRFKYNHELPVLLYSELHIKSKSGLNEVILFSKPNAGLLLQEAMKTYSLNTFLDEFEPSPSDARKNNTPA